MSEKEYKSYDSDDNFLAHNVRLTGDPQIVPTGTGQMVKLKFVSTSKSERHSDLWVEATVTDYDADKAAYLKKGDTISIEGKPALRMWGDNGDKISFELLRARLHLSVSQFVALKERGFAPGQQAAPQRGAKPAARPAASPSRSPKPAPRRPVVDIDDDE